MKNFTEAQRSQWESLFLSTLSGMDLKEDPSHDLAHFQRVAKTATAICQEERAQWEVVAPAAWLHDFVLIAKNDPRRSQASRL